VMTAIPPPFGLGNCQLVMRLIMHSWTFASSSDVPPASTAGLVAEPSLFVSPPTESSLIEVMSTGLVAVPWETRAPTTARLERVVHL